MNPKPVLNCMSTLIILPLGSTPGNRVPLTLHAKWPCVKRNLHANKATGHLKLGLVLKMKTLALQQT